MKLLLFVLALASCANPIDVAPTTPVERLQRACAADADCVLVPGDPNCIGGPCFLASNKANQDAIADEVREAGSRCIDIEVPCCEVASICVDGECRLINPDFGGRCLSVPTP